jgi:hypothetical protein
MRFEVCAHITVEAEDEYEAHRKARQIIVAARDTPAALSPGTEIAWEEGPAELIDD